MNSRKHADRPPSGAVREIVKKLGSLTMGDRFCITLIEAAEMHGFNNSEMRVLIDRHAGIAANVNGAWRIDPDALKSVLNANDSYLQAA